MSECGCSRRCTCTVTAGPGVTVEGRGSKANPYVISAGDAAPTALGVTDTPTVDLTLTGTGAPGDPYQVSADVILDPAPPGGGSNLVHSGPDGLYVECADVRGCLSAGDGIAYDQATGEIKARPSADAGNAVTIGGDGGLYAPAGGGGGPATVTTACGLTGDGSSGSPLAAKVAAAWPFPCDLDANGGEAYCDSAGALRTLPRGQASTIGDNRTTNFPNVRVPTGTTLTVVHTENMTVTNPSACLPAYVIYEAEIDADFDLPAPVSGVNGGAAALGFSTDEIQYIENSGSQLIKDTHFQLSRTYWGGVIPPGGTATQTVAVTMGRGAGNATYDRIQVTMRAFLINI